MKQILLLLFVLTMYNKFALAHEGHDHAPGEEDSPVTAEKVAISKEAYENLKVETSKATSREINKTVSLIGHIEAIPSKLAVITSRISGRVYKLHVIEGQTVRKGQAIIEVESRQPGEPPPRATYSAPMDGLVVERHVVLGDPVEPDKHLFDIA